MPSHTPHPRNPKPKSSRFMKAAIKKSENLAKDAYRLSIDPQKVMALTLSISGAGPVSKDPKDHDLLKSGHNNPQDDVFADAHHQEDHLPTRHQYYKAAEFNRALDDLWGLDDLYCDSHTYAPAEENQSLALDSKHAVLAWATGTLSCSPSALAMLNEAMAQSWSLSMENLNGPDFHLDVPEKRIVLDDGGLSASALGRSEYFRNTILAALCRALRDAWQEKRHGAFDEIYGPEAVLCLERVRAADLDVMTVLVAWELRSENMGSLWRHLIGGEDGDIALRYSAYLEREPAAGFNGRALAEAFAQWFRDESRVDACDHETLNYMDYLLDEYTGNQSFGDKKPSKTGIEILSCLPDKTAYLRGMGHEILHSPFYAGMSDPFNQIHFMQIMHDLKVTRVQDVPFQDAALAEKIFPGGEFTPEDWIPEDKL